MADPEEGTPAGIEPDRPLAEKPRDPRGLSAFALVGLLLLAVMYTLHAAPPVVLPVVVAGVLTVLLAVPMLVTLKIIADHVPAMEPVAVILGH